MRLVTNSVRKRVLLATQAHYLVKPHPKQVVPSVVQPWWQHRKAVWLALLRVTRAVLNNGMWYEARAKTMRLAVVPKDVVVQTRMVARSFGLVKHIMMYSQEPVVLVKLIHKHFLELPFVLVKVHQDFHYLILTIQCLTL